MSKTTGLTQRLGDTGAMASSCTYPQLVNNVKAQRPPFPGANKQANGYTIIRYSRLTNDAWCPSGVRAGRNIPTWCTRSLFSLISATEPVRRSPSTEHTQVCAALGSERSGVKDVWR
jgi:hypothetical protein